MAGAGTNGNGTRTLPPLPFAGGLELHSARLGNGLELYWLPDPSSEVVGVQLAYRVGSSDEEEGATGMAHFLEHLMFGATEDYGPEDFSLRLEAAGAQGLNAWTWLDETVYTASVPRAALPLLLELEASRMHRLRLEQSAFERERKVVLEERRYRVDNDPDGRMGERLYALAFPGHPYGWPTLGWERDVRAFRLDAVQEFYRRHYAPDQAALFLAGGVDGGLLELVERCFGSIPPSGRRRRPLPPPPPARELREELVLSVESERLLLGLRAPAWTARDHLLLHLLDLLLVDGPASRLSRVLLDGGLAAEVESFVPGFRGPALYELELVARPGVPASALRAALDRELRRLAEEGPSEAELRRAANTLRTRFWEGLSSSQGRAAALLAPVLLAGDPLYELRRLERLPELGPEQLREAARRLLLGPRVEVLGRPEAPRHDWSGPLPEPPPAPSGSLPPPPAGPGDASGQAEQDFERRRSGAVLLGVAGDGLPLLHLRLAFPAGSALDPPGRAGLASLAASMLLRGTRRLSRRDFEEALAGLGASLSTSVDPERTVLGGQVLAEHWPRFLELLAQALHEPAFEPPDFEQLRDEEAASLREARESDSTLASLAFWEAFHGADHPFGHEPGGTLSGLAALDPGQLADFHRLHHRGAGAVLGLAGALPPRAEEELAALLEPLAGGRRPSPVPPPPARGPRVLLVDRPDRNQVQVLGGQLAVPRGHPDQPALVLGDELLGGGFSSRLVRELREERGWTYGAQSWLRFREGFGSWQWWLHPSVERAAEAVRLVLRILEELRGGVPAGEHRQARDALRGRLPFLEETAEKRLALRVERALTGVDARELLERALETSREELAAALERHLRPREQVVVVVGPAERLAGPLSELGELEVRGPDEVSA